MNTNMTGFRWFSNMFRVLVLLTKVASALDSLALYCSLWPRQPGSVGEIFQAKESLDK